MPKHHVTQPHFFKPLQNTIATTPEKKLAWWLEKSGKKAILPDGLPAREAVTS
jgi:hypothetical protein